MPILFFGEEYWRRVVNFDALVEEGVIAERDLDLFTFVESAEQAWACICDHYAESQAGLDC
jgi:predicted Rossmann-fold nucleotide-binding protein